MLEKSRQAVPPALMAQLQLKPFDSLFLLKRLRYANGRAICYCENHCLPERVPGLLELDLNGSLTEIYQAHYDLHYARMQVRFFPTALPDEVAKALGPPPVCPPCASSDSTSISTVGCSTSIWSTGATTVWRSRWIPRISHGQIRTAKRHGAVTVTS